ncbi:hypothetical protein MOBT1_001287 [Malassezia obtusa]|uniref:Peroxidase n=1 Tax=Malassezia obtusa TaxID=76774 RepID=A0AAF0DZQ2_9BASI|nr:hypothetical protein MOBT1_001287 [Malassezia obtusa]
MTLARSSLRFSRVIRPAPASRFAAPRAFYGASRAYSTETPKPGEGSSVMFISGVLAAATFGYAFIIRDDFKFWAAGDASQAEKLKDSHRGLDEVKGEKESNSDKAKAVEAVSAAKSDEAKETKESKSDKASEGGDDKLPTIEDYQKVYNRIAESFDKDPDFDDGSYAPVVLRLSWHSSGTYDSKTKQGGSNGATMRFPKEANYDANAGMHNARNFLEPFKQEFPWISYSDLWTLGGVCATQEMGGPVIPWRPGRQDEPESETHADNLPDGEEDPNRLRSLADRLGFTEKELTALVGAHAMGRCHRQYSGFDGPWTHSPTMYSNMFYTELLNTEWKPRQWDGPFQYQDPEKQLMMLPSDYSFFTDSKFKEYVKLYAENDEEWRKDFASVYTKLLELGVPTELFQKAAKGLGTDEPIRFKTKDQQESAKQDSN